MDGVFHADKRCMRSDQNSRFSHASCRPQVLAGAITVLRGLQLEAHYYACSTPKSWAGNSTTFLPSQERWSSAGGWTGRSASLNG